MQPRLDHLIGRTVRNISTRQKQSALTLDGGYQIILTDKRSKWDKELVGKIFISVENWGKGEVKLLFNQGDVVVLKDKISIYSPDHDDVFDPYAEYQDEFPPDPSADRIKEGPTSAEDEQTQTGQAE
jgi:hypothetical protein